MAVSVGFTPAEPFVGGSGALLSLTARGSTRSSRGELGSGGSNVSLLRKRNPIILLTSALLL
jgi:hypothetical protein